MTVNVNQDWFVVLTIVNTLILLQAAVLIAVSTMCQNVTKERQIEIVAQP